MPEEKPQPQAPINYQQYPQQPQPAGAANAGPAPAAGPAAGPASLVQDSSYLNHHF